MLGQVFGTSRPAVGEHEVRLRNPQLLHFLLRFHNAMVLLPIDANVTPFVAYMYIVTKIPPTILFEKGTTESIVDLR